MTDVVQLSSHAKGFFEHLRATPQGTVLYCPGAAPHALGARLRVDVLLRSGPRVTLKGVVCWRRPGRDRASNEAGRHHTHAGIGVLLDVTEMSKIAFLDAYARGQVDDRRGGAHRREVTRQVIYITDKGGRLSLTRDIHPAGIGLYCSSVPQVGALLQLVLLEGAGLSAWRLNGRVVRHIEEDTKSAVGVELIFDSPERRAAFASALRRAVDTLGSDY